jgi:hypothetical protein
LSRDLAVSRSPVWRYADGIEENFTGKIAMVKTDNGWQEDRQSSSGERKQRWRLRFPNARDLFCCRIGNGKQQL